jgi:hypothetical protein
MFLLQRAFAREPRRTKNTMSTIDEVANAKVHSLNAVPFAFEPHARATHQSNLWTAAREGGGRPALACWGVLPRLP